jgi:hypothetical protein
MATVHLVSPALVKRTNDLLAKVRRERGIEKAMQDWIGLMDAEPSPQPSTEPPRAEPAVEPSAVAVGAPDATDP